jgi:hypothetical protein
MLASLIIYISSLFYMAIGSNPLSIIYHCLSSFLTMMITHPLSACGTAHYRPCDGHLHHLCLATSGHPGHGPDPRPRPNVGTIARPPVLNVLDRKPHVPSGQLLSNRKNTEIWISS